MQKDNSIMRFESVLPSDFDGVFRFSNPSDEDFIGVWGSKEYLFPAGTTVPIVMSEHSPIEIQHIRKKFAKDLAEREWFKSKGYKSLQKQEGTMGNRNLSSIHQAAQYTITDLEPYILKCLEPLPTSELLSRPVGRPALEDVIHRKDDGSFNTEVIAGGSNWKSTADSTSLVEKAKRG
jgi:hypothetical protein